jgi:hypothetical protein
MGFSLKPLQWLWWRLGIPLDLRNLHVHVLNVFWSCWGRPSDFNGLILSRVYHDRRVYHPKSNWHHPALGAKRHRIWLHRGCCVAADSGHAAQAWSINASCGERSSGAVVAHFDPGKDPTWWCIRTCLIHGNRRYAHLGMGYWPLRNWGAH